jgi:hypothetical protein
VARAGGPRQVQHPARAQADRAGSAVARGAAEAADRERGEQQSTGEDQKRKAVRPRHVFVPMYVNPLVNTFIIPKQIFPPVCTARTHTHIRTHAPRHTHTYSHKYTHIVTQKYTQTQILSLSHTHTHTHTYSHTTARRRILKWIVFSLHINKLNALRIETRRHAL